MVALLTFLTLIPLLVFTNLKTKTVKQSLIAFFLNFAGFLLIYRIVGVTSDAMTYHSEAIRLAESKDFGGFSEAIPGGKQFLSVFLALVYLMFGVNPIIPMIFLSFAYSFIPALVRKTWENCGLGTHANLAIWISITFPQVLFWSSFLKREGLSSIVLCGFMFLLSRILRARNAFQFKFQIFGTLFLAYHIRSQLILSLAISLFALVVYLTILSHKGQTDQKYKVYLDVIFAGLVLLFSFVITIKTGSSFILDLADREWALSDLSGDGKATLSSNPSISSSSTESNYYLFVLKVTMNGLLPSVFGPFPWDWLSIELALVGLDGLFLLLVFSILILGSFQFPQVRIVTTLAFLNALPLLLGSSYILANYGLAMRVRDLCLVLFSVPLAAIIQLFLKSRKASIE